MFFLLGFACHKQATIPAVIGLEKDVPLLVVMLPLAFDTTLATPFATTSGLTLPSVLGPIELKFAKLKLASIAPTVIILSASPGKVIYGHPLPPVFPALFTTIIPFRAHIVAALLAMDVFPSNCAKV